MNPFTFNVELFHQKNPSRMDPHDILAPDYTRPKHQNVLSAIKLLGGLTVRHAGFMAAGGVLAVGCTLRFLRNRRKRFRDEKASTAGFEARGGSKTDACTQTESLEDLVLREEVALGHQDVSLEESTFGDAEKLDEGGRNLSNVTGVSNSYTTPECNCTAARAAESVKQASSPHLHCNVSAFLALLALHKTLMYEASISARQDKNLLHKTAYESETRQFSTDVRKDDHTAPKDISKDEVTELSALVRSTEITCPRKDKGITAARGLGIAVVNSTRISPIQPRPNPFNIEDQRGQVTATCTSEQKNKVDPNLKCELSVPREASTNQEDRPEDGCASGGPSNLRRHSQDVRNYPQSAEKAVAPGTIKPRSRGDNGKVGFRVKTRSDTGNFPQRGKSRRRGSGRKNIPRRPYVDLDKPKSIAS